MPSHNLCMIPGPIELEPSVSRAMSTLATSHVDPSFINTFGETLELLRTVLMCKNSQPFVLSGSGTLGWDMVACNLVERGEPCLVVNTGLFGDRFGECFETYGGTVTHVKANEIGGVPSMDAIKHSIQSAPAPFKVVTITHVDTSTGVLTDIVGISKLVHQLSPSTLVIVDAVCSAGSEEINMDAWGIDVVLTASQKGLGAPPGLSILVANDRAMSVFNNRQSPPSSYFASWAKWIPIMTSYELRKGSYFATPAVQLIIALNTSLKLIVSRPLAGRFAQHIAVSKHVKQLVTSWGLELVPKTMDIAANSITAFYCPNGLTVPNLLKSITSKGVVIAGGLHPVIATKYLRIGHMGYSVTDDAHLQHFKKTLDAVEHALRENGFAFANKEPKSVVGHISGSSHALIRINPLIQSRL